VLEGGGRSGLGPTPAEPPRLFHHRLV